MITTISLQTGVTRKIISMFVVIMVIHATVLLQTMTVLGSWVFIDLGYVR